MKVILLIVTAFSLPLLTGCIDLDLTISAKTTAVNAGC